jgi:hypothetical protein
MRSSKMATSVREESSMSKELLSSNPIDIPALVAELRAVDNRPDFAQIYLRHLCLRAADALEISQAVSAALIKGIASLDRPTDEPTSALEPDAVVVNDNQPHWTGIFETQPNVTLPVGTRLVRIEKAQAWEIIAKNRGKLIAGQCSAEPPTCKPLLHIFSAQGDPCLCGAVPWGKPSNTPTEPPLDGDERARREQLADRLSWPQPIRADLDAAADIIRSTLTKGIAL